MADEVRSRSEIDGRLKSFLPLITILLMTLAVYGCLSGFDFVTVDDPLYVVNNERVRSGFSPGNVAWAFQTMEAEFWHPLTWLSFMLDTEIYGTGPRGYHLTNLLLHLINSALLFIFCRRCLGGLWESWLVAGLFALHPLHVEPVAWVSGRKEILCACFWLLALLAYERHVRRPGWRRFIPVMVFFVLGMMAKPMIVTLPFLLLLLDYWPYRRDRNGGPVTGWIKSPWRRWRPLVAEKIPLFLFAAAGMAVAMIAQQRGGGLVSTMDLPPASRAFQVLAAYAVYLKKSVWPAPMAVFYPQPAFTGCGMAAAATGILLAVTVMIVRIGRHRRYLFTGWFWFLGTLVPVIGIVKVGDFFIADRYMYMPLAGILIVIVFSLKAMIDKLVRRRTWLTIVPVLLAGIYAPLTWAQVQTWRDSETLYRHALAVTGDNFLAHHALGHTLAMRNDMTGAIDHFYRAAVTRPDKAPLWVSLGKALVLDDQWQPAEQAFWRAARLAPDRPAVWFYLGCVRIVQQDSRMALNFLADSLVMAREQNPLAGPVYAKLMDFYENGLYYDEQGQWPLAGSYYLKALALACGDLSRRGITRLVVDGYDQWLKGVTGIQEGAD